MDSQSEKAEREESRLQFNKQLFKTYLALDHWHRFRLRLFLEGILGGNPRRNRRRSFDCPFPFPPGTG